MILAITDANIFIDLFEIDLIEPFFELDLMIYTSQDVLLECDKNQRQQLTNFIENKKLVVQTISEKEEMEMDSMNFNKGLSETDRSVLFIAKKQNGMVLSGDKLVRKWCKKNQIEVHGILWVLDEMQRTKLIDIQEVIDKMELLLQINFWLPMNATTELLEKWRKLL